MEDGGESSQCILRRMMGSSTRCGVQDGGSVLQQACGMMGRQPGGLEVSLGQLLHQTVMDAADAGVGDEGGSKRQRAEPASTADQPVQ